MNRIYKILLRGLLGISLLLPGYALATDEEELLTPEQAFPAEIVAVDDKTISIRWHVADKYYLYRTKFRFMQEQQGIELGEPVFPPGKIKQDEFFGEIETYRGDVTVALPYSTSANAPSNFKLTTISQGCADLGVCYPPHKQSLQVQLPTATASPIPDPLAVLSKLSQSFGLGSAAEDNFLEVEQAFQLEVSNKQGGQIKLDFTAAEGYYLYQNKIKIAIAGQPANPSLGEPVFPEGTLKHDEYFGDVSVYYEGAIINVPLINKDKQAQPLQLLVQYQGCADAGLCYPPVNQSFALSAPPTSANNPEADNVLSKNETAAGVALGDAIAAILAAFGVGFLLTFTPCVLPMIPILSSIIIGQSDKQPSAMRAGTLSVVYVLGTAVTYTAVGVLAGATGDQLQAHFQNPWVIGTFIAILLALALSMFGLYEVQMPSFIQSRLQNKSQNHQGGTYTGVFMLGLFSAAIVGACVSPGLIAVLGIAMQTQDPVLGGAIMFSMAMGMGIVLIMIGFGLGMMPKAGAWMDITKHVFGVSLLGVAIYLLSLIPGTPVLYLWSALLIVSGVFMKATQALPEKASGWQYLWKGLGMFLIVWGFFALLGAFTGNRDIMKPIEFAPATGGTAVANHASLFTQINTVEEFEAQLVQAGAQNKPVIIDFYADWCTDCLRMEKGTFSQPEVSRIMREDFVALQIDVTENNEIDRQIKKHLGIFGPPAILFYSATGKPIKSLNFYGYKTQEEFIPHLKQALSH